MEINIKTEIDKLLYATVRNIMTEIVTQKQIINAFFRIIQIDAIETNTKNKGLDVILIDNYMFKVLSWSLLPSPLLYDLVNIKSININNLTEITYFTVYNSKSEFGIWRLLSTNTAPGLYKGDEDYIQQTTINIKLQLYINKNKIDQFNNSQFYVFIDNKEKLYFNIDMGLPASETNITNSHINDDRRKLRIDPFINYNDQPKNKCDYDNSFHKVLVSDINKRLTDLSSSIELNPKYKIKKITKIGDHQSSVDLPKLSVYSLLFEDDLILYYFTFIHNSKKYFSPIILLSHNSTITNYGTYLYYVLAGDYICKPNSGNPSVGENDKIIVKGSRYTFIADRYTNLYPYTKHDITSHECGACTFINDPGISKCGMCGEDI